MTRIEVVAIVPASVTEVWRALVDHERWPEWRAYQDALFLGAVEPVNGAIAGVGDRRRCTAVAKGLPLVGPRQFSWEELITDVAPERTLELEACGDNSMLRRWRVRVWLAAQPDGQTRIRCHISYLPATLAVWLGDQCFLRRRIELAASAWLASMAVAFEEELSRGCETSPAEPEMPVVPSAPVAA